MPLAGDGVAIQPRDAGFRERAVQFLFHLLRPEPEKVDVLALALRADAAAPSRRNCSSGTACAGRGGDRSASREQFMHSSARRKRGRRRSSRSRAG